MSAQRIYDDLEESKMSKLDNAIKEAQNDVLNDEEDEPEMVFQTKVIAERESDYQKQRFNRELEKGSYKELMKKRQEQNSQKDGKPSSTVVNEPVKEVPTPRKRRWDVTSPKKEASEWDIEVSSTQETPKSSIQSTPLGQFQETPKDNIGETPVGSSWSDTPVTKKSRWDMTPSSTPKTPSLDKRNRYQTDEELNSMFPTEGYFCV